MFLSKVKNEKLICISVLWEAQHWPGDEDLGDEVNLDDEGAYEVDGVVAAVSEELICSSPGLPVLEQASKIQ